MALRSLIAVALAVALPAMPVAAGGSAARVTWRPAAPEQGDPLLVVVRLHRGLVPASGRFMGRRLHFFPWGHGAWRALVPIPVRTRPGAHRLVLRLRRHDRIETVVRRVKVAAGHFETERLEVDPRFTKPPRRFHPKIIRDRRRFRRAFAGSRHLRLWRAPFVVPLHGRTTDPFGVKRTFNGHVRSRHLGLDIDGNTGEPVEAAASGRVVIAHHLFYSGNTVVIDHGLGLFTLYFHLSKIDVSPGDTVGGGEVIGLVGATGRATGPHLHFGVKLEGRYVNPLRLLHLAFGPDPAG